MGPPAAPLLVYPDPPPPALAAALDGAALPWKSSSSLQPPADGEAPDGWPGAVVWAGDDPEAAFAACRALRRRQDPPLPILVLVTAAQLGHLAGREDLFDDFALWPPADGEIDIRMSRLLWGDQGADVQVVHYGPLALNLETYQAVVGGRPLDLTYMEYELLRFLATHPGKVFTREALLSQVWGYEYYGGARTVDVHVRRLRAKLGEEHASLISTVRSVGYRFGQSRWAT
jgi:DNA-binding response OmpR family regulator